jgi:AraC-like DNA-binding protein
MASFTSADLTPRIYHYRRIVKARLFIDSHFAEEINLGEIAEESSFSKFYFIRLFKDLYGHTPSAYLSHVRINQACRLLEQGISVTGACFNVGFSSPASFTHLFKRIRHTTPSSYQRNYFQRKAAMRANPLHFIPGCFSGSGYTNQESRTAPLHLAE